MLVLCVPSWGYISFDHAENLHHEPPYRIVAHASAAGFEP